MSHNAAIPVKRRPPILPPRTPERFARSRMFPGARAATFFLDNVGAGATGFALGPWVPAGATITNISFTTAFASSVGGFNLMLVQQGANPEGRTHTIFQMYGDAQSGIQSVTTVRDTIPLRYRVTEPGQLAVTWDNTGNPGTVDFFAVVTILDPDPVTIEQ